MDLDVCDRAVVPACPASLPGGISADELRQLVLSICLSPQVTSVDFAEVDALADSPDGRTVRLVALGVLDVMTSVALRKNLANTRIV